MNDDDEHAGKLAHTDQQLQPFRAAARELLKEHDCPGCVALNALRLVGAVESRPTGRVEVRGDIEVEEMEFAPTERAGELFDALARAEVFRLRAELEVDHE